MKQSLRVTAALTAFIVTLNAGTAFAAPAWLDHLNSIRRMGSLPAVTENTTWSSGCYAHSRYMALNRVITHYELSSLPYYSDAGDLAARRSNIALGAGGTTAIDLWAIGPFHAVGMLDPGLKTTGFGNYTSSTGMPAASLDVIRGLGAPPSTTSYPILWPGRGATSDYLRYGDGEYPDPLSGTGFSAPSGPPIIAQFGAGGLTPSVSASRLSCEGTSLQHAVYSETTYRNSDSAAQSTGRGALNSRDAVVMMPRNPLLPGKQYDVSMTVNGRTYSWSFYTAGGAALTLYAPSTSNYAGPASATAKLLADGAPLAGRTVAIQTSYDARTWTTKLQTTTDASGLVRTPLAPTRKTYLRAVFAGDATFARRTTAVRSILPKAKLGAPGLASTMYVSRSRDATGSLNPRHTAGSAAVRVDAQRYESGRWVTRARFTGYSTGYAYRTRVSLPLRGTWRLRAVHVQDAYNAAALSTWRTVTVR